jgi:indolepyruvate ferredoxin oxidoreductase alpha subunit
MPALVNGVYNNSNFTLLIVDNSATAMTGFQPHPGTGQLATGEPAAIVDMEAVCRAMGASVEICDPFDLKKTTETLLRKMQEDGGPKVVIMRHMCQLVKAKRKIPPAYKIHVDGSKCLADNCGCNRLCTRLFACPGLMVDNETGKAAIDEALCVGCGLCSDICPVHAIVKEEANR